MKARSIVDMPRSSVELDVWFTFQIYHEKDARNSYCDKYPVDGDKEWDNVS
ncbi:MAG TPA: hypothetical protein VFE98_04445 [Candidatus Bathyarchaeia archaeon]|nr:hypothetical protein [Candidatus Bathyarchaeia archaeon]